VVLWGYRIVWVTYKSTVNVPLLLYLLLFISSSKTSYLRLVRQIRVMSNTNAGLFLTAVLAWFTRDFERVINRLDTVNNARAIEWRTDTVTDFRGHPVPAAAERLIRWDTRHPDQVFQHGFVPQYAPPEGDALPDQYLNLETYVGQNTPSIFVSTARYYNQDGRNQRWTPRNIANRFEYEIFAYGGIDINLSLGHDHQYSNQREIAFPGGIRPEFIRTAREYDGDGRIIRIWANGGFDPSANGASHSPDLRQFPDPVCGSRIPVVYWTGPNSNRHDELRRDTMSAVEPMREDGGLQTDDLFNEQCPAILQPSEDIDSVRLDVQLSDDLSSGTDDDILAKIGTGEKLITLFKAPSRGESKNIEVNLQEIYGKSRIRITDLKSLTIFQAPVPHPIASDDFKIKGRLSGLQHIHPS
jgi:hypothetical protein